MKQQLIRYWLAMNATAMQSAVHAVRAFCGLAGVHQIYSPVNPLDAHQAAMIFLFAFGAAILKYIDNHPLPDPSTIQPLNPSTPPK